MTHFTKVAVLPLVAAMLSAPLGCKPPASASSRVRADDNKATGPTVTTTITDLYELAVARPSTSKQMSNIKSASLEIIKGSDGLWPDEELKAKTWMQLAVADKEMRFKLTLVTASDGTCTLASSLFDGSSEATTCVK